MTDQEREKIVAAMEKANGSYAMAAILLGCSSKKLYHTVIIDAQLRERWPKDYAPPVPEKALNTRPPLDMDVAPDVDAVELAKSVMREDRQFKQGLMAIGRTEEQAKKALALQQLTGRFFKNTVELMHGGMVSNFLDCLVERETRQARLNKITEDLKDTTQFPYGSVARDQMVREEVALARQMRDLGLEVQQTNKIVYQGALVLSVMRKNGPKKQPKLGFKDANVVIEEEKDMHE